MSEMRSEPIPKVPCLLVGGPLDGELRNMPVTKSGTPAPFINAVVVASMQNGVTVRRGVPYRLERAAKVGAHALAGWRYVVLNITEPMPEHDWDNALMEIEETPGE